MNDVFFKVFFSLVGSLGTIAEDRGIKKNMGGQIGKSQILKNQQDNFKDTLSSLS